MANPKVSNKHMGSTLDSFLDDEGILEELTVRAQQKVLAYQIDEAMKAQNITKTEMARRMKTSRSQVDKLLDPDNNRYRADTAQKAAAALGKTLYIGMV
ncbi:MAG: XRE family transcriptional regulator [Rhodospirillales bacterium]|jgi:antitoxin HicB|nr:XRE family transcriptional regulator [Rhodospirillales bacterium]MBT4041832.1 XRE family transcriptional regulator [Rhodospirillales bacterium]MBT4627463.1 XRE family transcriptional regulator [Rhodospirillales bacterium]MBT5351631.1 XRE family transcriptional regulator [Rhodospirillales bacterium]MBT5521187.1 XRE family transcriptional regulator [Rhodospirillales bacterium]